MFTPIFVLLIPQRKIIVTFEMLITVYHSGVNMLNYCVCEYTKDESLCYFFKSIDGLIFSKAAG